MTLLQRLQGSHFPKEKQSLYISLQSPTYLITVPLRPHFLYFLSYPLCRRHTVFLAVLLTLRSCSYLRTFALALLSVYSTAFHTHLAPISSFKTLLTSHQLMRPTLTTSCKMNPLTPSTACSSCPAICFSPTS